MKEISSSGFLKKSDAFILIWSIIMRLLLKRKTLLFPITRTQIKKNQNLALMMMIVHLDKNKVNLKRAKNKEKNKKFKENKRKLLRRELFKKRKSNQLLKRKK
jgi:hypothetical protein